MASSLPQYVVLKCKPIDKYLECVNEGPAEGYARFSGEDVHSPQSKFHVEPAESDSQLVHLRCCYNNKYLVASNPHWIRPEADKPEEDPSLWSCTLFHPVPCGGHDYRFKHMKSGNYARLIQMGNADATNNCLYPERADLSPDLWDVCTVIDWKSLLVLPRHVAFKGDNDKYLGASVFNPAAQTLLFGRSPILQFVTSDSRDEGAAHEVFPNPDGSIRLKSTYYGNFWSGSNYIFADSHDTSTEDRYSLFWPIKIDDNTIALRSLGNNHFCKRYTEDLSFDCFNACASTISKEARLQVTELVLSRDIFNVNYDMSRVRRYNERAVLMGTGAASNTTDKENSMAVRIEHTETETDSWGGSVSLMLGVKTTLETKVPMVFEGKIEISAELTTSFEWGKEHTKTNTIETVYNALVPPLTRATVTAVGTASICDIPFSYAQTDTLMGGTKVTHVIDSGIYTGVKTFSVTYQIKHEKINPAAPKVE